MLRATFVDGVPEGVIERILPNGIVYEVPFDLFPAGCPNRVGEPLQFASFTIENNVLNLELAPFGYLPDLAKWFASEASFFGFEIDPIAGPIQCQGLADVPFEVLTDLLERVRLEKFLNAVLAQFSFRATG